MMSHTIEMCDDDDDVKIYKSIEWAVVASGGSGLEWIHLLFKQDFLCLYQHKKYLKN